MQQLITSSYEHKLALTYHDIDNKGMLLDHNKLINVKKSIKKELDINCAFLSEKWGFPVYFGAGTLAKDTPNFDKALNVNAWAKLLERLKALGYKVPKVRKKDEETHEYEWEESVAEIALQQLLADYSLWPINIQDAGDCIKKLLETREIITFKNRYANARLFKNQFFASHSITGTKTGRRSSKKNIFGYGGNDQNFPARGRLSDLWKETIISRPGRIFFFCDQMQAEDWPVQALSANHIALSEMLSGVNRHYKFAVQIFNRNIDDLKFERSERNNDTVSKANAEMQYYMGKKGRYANNYGMQPRRFSESLAGEGGFTVSVEQCKNILNIIDRLDPNVKRVFHTYVQERLHSADHMLRTPLGRERAFIGLRSNEKNYSILNEAYAWIPQSIIGDNTGLAVLGLSECNSNNGDTAYITQEGHDSIVQECLDNEGVLRSVLQNIKKSFDRKIVFDNGIEINIPIEGALGYDWKNKVKINDKAWEFDEGHLLEAYKKVREQKEERQEKESQECATSIT